MNHPELVKTLAKPGQDILATLTPRKVHLWHMATGICTEAGELLDAIKKHVIYNQPIDIPNVVEEHGDIDFYLEGLRQGLQLVRESIISNNIEKLTKRYGETYTDKGAKERLDKQP